MEKKKELLKALPKVDECLGWLETELAERVPSRIIKQCIQESISKEREKILSGKSAERISQKNWVALFSTAISEKMSFNFKRIINATGVVIHTNLGRSLLPHKASELLLQAGSYYSNLEFNLATGKRGSRYSLVEQLICELTGAEAALVVNNNAAAVLLVLDTLAKDTEVIVSRGQLVEIGGSFRIPDVMEKSGAKLVEVGATNRTHKHDYVRAINERTSMLLRVHTSNFKVIGFTSDISGEELSGLAKEHGLISMEDLGSGSFVDLSQYGLEKEPTVQEVVKSGIDIVTFSGDKLLGGPQAGIIVGSKDVVERVKKNPLNRALRIDKFTLASLETILRFYFDTDLAMQTIPTLSMLTAAGELLKKRAQKIRKRIKDKIAAACDCEIESTNSKVGGGAMPDCNLLSYAVTLMPKKESLNRIEQSFRNCAVPIVGRIENEKFVLDVRTIQDVEIPLLCDQIVDCFSTGEIKK